MFHFPRDNRVEQLGNKKQMLRLLGQKFRPELRTGWENLTQQLWPDQTRLGVMVYWRHIPRTVRSPGFELTVWWRICIIDELTWKRRSSRMFPECKIDRMIIYLYMNFAVRMGNHWRIENTNLTHCSQVIVISSVDLKKSLTNTVSYKLECMEFSCSQLYRCTCSSWTAWFSNSSNITRGRSIQLILGTNEPMRFSKAWIPKFPLRQGFDLSTLEIRNMNEHKDNLRFASIPPVLCSMLFCSMYTKQISVRFIKVKRDDEWVEGYSSCDRLMQVRSQEVKRTL